MKCRICNNPHENQVYQVREMMFGLRDVFTYFQCSRCGCLQIQGFPPDMSKYYPTGYSGFSLLPYEQFKNPIEHLVRTLRDSYAVLNKGTIGKFLFDIFPNGSLRSLSRVGITKRSKILDVGCGSGFVLYSLKNLGFQNLLGIDPYISADVTYKNGLTILKKSIYELSGEWDLIMFHHSFEHVSDPLETLQFSSKRLAQNGVCLVRVPTVSSYAWEHYRTDWVQLDAPRHFFLHSVTSMELLASKVGLELEDVVYDSTEVQFWGSEQYMRGVPLESEESYKNNPLRSILSILDLRSFRKRAKQLNAQKRGDQAAFYLTKRY